MSVGTAARLLLLLGAIINRVLVYYGYSPIDAMVDEETITSLVSDIYLIGSAIIAAWKNNSVTKAAKVGDEAKDDYKMAQKAKKKMRRSHG